MRNWMLAAALLLAAAGPEAGAGREYVQQGILGEGQLRGITYVACAPEGKVAALQFNGTVTVYDREGQTALTFGSGLEKAVVVACDPKGNLYVVGLKTEPQELKFGNQTVKREVPVGALCRVFDGAGKQVRQMELKDAKAVSSGMFSNGRLLLADRATASIAVYHPESGARMGAVGKNIRSCCGILGFGVNARQDILVANLGAFRVDIYSADGKPLGGFGKRGEDESSFHGCCNPVNVAVLPDERLMTVEKDTTRVKIYDAAGKRCEQVLRDVTELVQGCAYIPMAVDASGNVYLANVVKGCIVKCGPKA